MGLPHAQREPADESAVSFSFDELRAILAPRAVHEPDSAWDDRISGVSTDTRSIVPGDLFVALVGENFDGHVFVADAFARGAAAAVVSQPGGAIAEARGPVFVVNDTLEALGAVANAHRRVSGVKVVGITGTNGKTTTKELLAHLLGEPWEIHRTQGNHNNLVGVPLTLLGISPRHRVAVVEMGTNAPGEIERLAAIAEPDCGILTSVGEGHLEGLGSIDGVMEEKSALLAALPRNGVAVVNFDNPHCVRASKAAPPCTRLISYGLDARCEFRGTSVALGYDGISFRMAGLPTRPRRIRKGLSGLWRTRARSGRESGNGSFFVPMTGLHNVSNALAAIAAAWWAGVDFVTIQERLATFEPPALRLTRRELLGGRVVLLDDCYNANPASMAGALATLAHMPAQRRVAVLGHMGELGDLAEACHRQLGQSLARHGVQVAITVGEHARTVAAEARRTGVQAMACRDAESAADVVLEVVEPGDVMLIKGSRSVGLECVATLLAAQARRLPERWSQQESRRIA